MLKNTCQLEAALLNDDQAQIDENTTQIGENIADVDDRCPGVDESLFIDPEGAPAPAPAANAPDVAEPTDAPQEDAVDDAEPADAQEPADATEPADAEEPADNAAGDTAVQFDDVDISKLPGVGDDALAAAKSVCPGSDGATLLEQKRLVAENTEVEKFNPAIEAAAADNDEALETALLCQQNRNKVLKNTCQLERALIEDDQAQIDENNVQIPSNMAQVDKFCPVADEGLFI